MSLSDRGERRAHLGVRLKHPLGALRLEVAFELTRPWTVLFGPSGSGKTTVLRTIAGFVLPDAGRIVQGAQAKVLLDRELGVCVAAHLRPVRSAAQTPRLFPHKTVGENVRFGCGWPGRLGDEAEVVKEVLELFRLGALAGRLPRELSGGEMQKVSVARAVASAITFAGGSENVLLLLDEPFNGLDLPIRDELLAALQEWLLRWKTPVLSVTHDLGEAFQLGAEVIKIGEGKVLEQGRVEVVLAEERERLMRQLSHTVRVV